MTWYELVDNIKESIIERIEWETQNDEDFEFDVFIDNLEHEDVIMETIDSEFPIYNIDIIDVFKSNSDLWFGDNEFGGEEVLDVIRGTILTELSNEIHSWWYGDGEDECREIFDEYVRKEKESE